MSEYSEENNHKIREKIESSFTDEIITELVQSLKATYDFVCSTYDEAEGCDAQVFGTSIWKINENKLKALAATRPDLMTVNYQHRMFRLTIGALRMGCYKVGWSASVDIASAFPKSKAAGGSLSTMFLPGFEFPDLLAAKHIFLVHVGNAEEGLCAAFLCIPTSIDKDDRISEWGFILPIYGENALLPEFATEPLLAPIEMLPPPEITPQRKRQISESQ